MYDHKAAHNISLETQKEEHNGQVKNNINNVAFQSVT